MAYQSPQRKREEGQSNSQSICNPNTNASAPYAGHQWLGNASTVDTYFIKETKKHHCLKRAKDD